MYNAKLPKNWKPCTQDPFVKSFLNMTIYSVIEDQLDLTRDLSYLPHFLRDLNVLNKADYIYFALYAGTPIRMKKQGKLPESWSGPQYNLELTQKLN